MKPTVYFSALTMVALLSLPTTSDAFSRRSNDSEIVPRQDTTVPYNLNNGNVSAQSVPEPPVLVLMSIGLGVFGAGHAMSRFRKQS